MNKFRVLGTIFVMGWFWIGLLCATLQCCFHINEMTVAYVGTVLVILSLIGFGICMYKSDKQEGDNAADC